jgi:hypothetical protein
VQRSIEPPEQMAEAARQDFFHEARLTVTDPSKHGTRQTFQVMRTGSAAKPSHQPRATVRGSTHGLVGVIRGWMPS